MRSLTHADGVLALALWEGSSDSIVIGWEPQVGKMR
jgi:hypothetical protein